MQPEPQFVPPHVRLAVVGTGVVEVVAGTGVVEVVVGTGVVEVVVVEVGLQWGHEYMTFLHVES